MYDHCFRWQCIIPQNSIISFLCVFPSSLMSALVAELALMSMKEVLTPWPVCEEFPPTGDAVPKSQLSCSSGRKERLCPAGGLPQLFPGMTSEQLGCICANLHMFFHFRVAVTFYLLLSGEGGILRHWGCCLQCQGSDEVQPGMDQDFSSSVLSHLWIVSCGSNSCGKFFKSLV